MAQKLINTKKRLYLLYWFTFMGMGAAAPFISLYYKKILIAPDGSPAINFIGTILMIQPLLALLANPLAGTISDRYRMEHRVLFLCALAVSIGGLLISLPGFTNIFPMIDDYRYLVIAIGILFIGLFQSPIVPIINSTALEYLHDTGDDPKRYGEFRVVGTLGWIFITSLVGFILEITGIINIPPLLFAFGYFILAMVAASGIKGKLNKRKLPWKYLVQDKFFLLFIIFVFIQSFGHMPAFNFTSYFMDDVNVSFLFIGLAFGISSISEVPVMLYSRKIINHLGNRKMIIIGTSMLALKLLLLVFVAPLKNPLLMILAMSVHGIGYGLQFVGMINYLDELAPREMKNTYMNLFNVLGVSIAIALGTKFTAFIIEIFDSQLMMIINAGIILLSVVYFILLVKTPGSTKTEAVS
ncbi:MAG: MFS transporter [Spirochaetales bacterium]|nr:MFS transporter [Spirochaetales bacterium]